VRRLNTVTKVQEAGIVEDSSLKLLTDYNEQIEVIHAAVHVLNKVSIQSYRIFK